MVDTKSEAAPLQVEIPILASPDKSERFTLKGEIGTFGCRKRFVQECNFTLCAFSVDLTELGTDSDARSVGCNERRHVSIEMSQYKSAC